MTPTPEKIASLLTRACNVFTHKLAIHNATVGQTRRVDGSKFREKIDDDVFFLCMCWHAWQDDLKRCTTATKLAALNDMFYRGTLDDALLPAMRTNNPDFKAGWEHVLPFVYQAVSGFGSRLHSECR